MKILKLKPKDIMLVNPGQPGEGEPPGETIEREDIEIAPPPKSEKDKPKPKDDKEQKDQKGQGDKEEKPEDPSDDDTDDVEQEPSPGGGKSDKEDDKEEDPKPDDKDQSGGGDADPDKEEEPEDDKDGEDGSGTSNDDDKEKDNDEPKDDGDGSGDDKPDIGDDDFTDDEEPEDGDDKEGSGSDDTEEDPEGDDAEDDSDGGDGDSEPSDDDSDSTDNDTDTGSDADPEDNAPAASGKVNQSNIDKLKDELKVHNDSGLAAILNADRNDDMHHLGSHDEEGSMTNDQTQSNADDPHASDADSDFEPGDLDLYMDDELNNLIDSEEEINQAVQSEKERKQSDKAGAGNVGISDIHMTDKSVATQTEIMSHVNKWIKKIKGDKEYKTIWKSDDPSRKIKGLWGRELDAPPKEETKNKVLLFIFDTSGSMPTRLMAAVCSDIALKMSKDRIVNKVAMLNIEGVWGHPKKFQPVMGIKQRMRAFLKISTGSDLKPAWTAIEHMLITEKKKISDISGIILVTDFQVSSFRIPDAIRKLKPSILAINIGDPRYGDTSHYASRFIKENNGVAIFGLSLNGKKVKVLNTLKVGNK